MARPVILGPKAEKNADGKLHRKDPLEPVEFDADTLVRHAFVCGASGFGKTVFCKGLVEESVRAGIPVVAIDLKGDLASLALTGRYTKAEELKKVFGDEEGAQVAAEYEAGAGKHGLNRELADVYASRAHIRLFTPNSSLGRRVALSALPSFSEPPNSALEREERDELVQALVLGFAHSMYGTPAAVKKNEPAVKVIEELVRWCAQRGEALEGAAGISRLLDLVREPPFESMGGMPLDQYLPVRDKQRLMQKLNSRLLGAERSRYEGPRLSIETLLDDVPEGKTPLSIVYLGHISDFTEQASIVGLLCADVYRWMRKTGGSSGVRLMMYVDELGGGDAKHAFYPSAPHNPPSKAPLNLLVRQGRSAGIAMLLATQNPMSVDVRGLGNINTWAIGRLTRKNDHLRVEDLLARLPPDPPPTQVVSQLPQGIMLTMSDALHEYVCGRWLYSIHRQLAPGVVGAISQLTDERPPEPVVAPAVPPPPIARVEPTAASGAASPVGAGVSRPPASAPAKSWAAPSAGASSSGTPLSEAPSSAASSAASSSSSSSSSSASSASAAIRTAPASAAARPGPAPAHAGPLPLDDADYDLVPVEPLEYEDTLAPDDFDLDDLDEDADGTPVPSATGPVVTRKTRSRPPKVSLPPGTPPVATPSAATPSAATPPATGRAATPHPATGRAATPPPATPREKPAASPSDDLDWDLVPTPKPPFGRNRGSGSRTADEPVRTPTPAPARRSRTRAPASEPRTPGPAPERAATERTANDRASTRPAAPARGAPERGAPERTSPERTSPDQTSPDRTSPDRTSPDRTSPERSATSRPPAITPSVVPVDSLSGAPPQRTIPGLSEQPTVIRPIHATPTPAPTAAQTRGGGQTSRTSAPAAFPPEALDLAVPTEETAPRKKRKGPSKSPRRKASTALAESAESAEPVGPGAGDAVGPAELVFLPVQLDDLQPPPSAEAAPTPPVGPDRLMEEAETSEYPPLDEPITGGGFDLVDPPEEPARTTTRSRAIRFEPPTTTTTSASTRAAEEPTHAGPTLRLVSSEVDPSGETDAVHTAGSRAADPTTRRRAHDPGEEHTSAGPTLRLATSDVDPSEETDAVRTAASRAADPTTLRPVRVSRARPVEEDDTGALLAETGVRSRMGLEDALRDPTHTAWVPGPKAKEGRKDDQTAWVPGPPRAEPRAEPGAGDDGESLTLTFARPAVTSGPSGWIVKHGTRAWPVPTDKPLSIGRSRSCDVQLDDPYVSGDHLELRIDGRALVVREKIAKNRTRLDGEEIIGDVRIEPAKRTWTLRLAEVEVLLSWSAPLPGGRR